jgi:hypothetical protein
MWDAERHYQSKSAKVDIILAKKLLGKVRSSAAVVTFGGPGNYDSNFDYLERLEILF